MSNDAIPLTIHAVNATVMMDVTPTGKNKFIIQLNENSGDAIDRVQRCHDYRLQLLGSKNERLDEHAVFKDHDAFLIFCTLPRSNNSVFLVTCKCEQSSMSQDEALSYIKKGIDKALVKVEKLTRKLTRT